MNWKGVGKTVQKPVITFVTQMLRNMRHFWVSLDLDRIMQGYNFLLS